MQCLGRPKKLELVQRLKIAGDSDWSVKKGSRIAYIPNVIIFDKDHIRSNIFFRQNVFKTIKFLTQQLLSLFAHFSCQAPLVELKVTGLSFSLHYVFILQTTFPAKLPAFLSFSCVFAPNQRP